MGGRHFGDVGAQLPRVLEQLPRVASVLVKGSRFMKMERVVQAITAHEQQTTRSSSHAA
jgi:UDP-N-acetylmuramoyl-tripeptide--D-alanyl-D-alanine ligase